MANPVGTLLHHSEPIDPDLWEWLSAKIDHVLGVSSGVMVIVLGAVIVLFPIAVVVLVWRKWRTIS
ncbi:MAG TPA: hypothetical protein QF694_06410 [Dehalococcoidia bacterium]|jgi:hypothetical protein|nr:hypothetical protein [Chloroflexota bacterium]MDP6055895.1 hypothetical protein [Dehalococcoidia bacterium]MDP7089711.1 hypothetical protein [Dehalococcoidia bacterium]MDP7261907.1 hypothetical protein [Dehalococcoidia bacterium]MDP7485268.1 hypothetical protein [Dehalococcoidia bacterium]|tara:strand:- start:211 stop:408 length:198 start_codon:yes stop_codon:yes gene_type:complete